MFIDTSLIRKNKNYRWLYTGQIISFFGSMMTYMAVPYQIYALTKSSFWVGLLGTMQLIPLLVFGLIGGVYADRFERKKILIVSEIILSLGALLLFINCFLAEPSVYILFGCSIVMSALNGFHRPAMEALTPVIVEKNDLTQVGAMNSFKFSFGAIAGPALSGVLIAKYGIKASYVVDFFTFVFSIFCLYKVTVPQYLKLESADSTLTSIKEGFSYAVSRPELVGTYMVDILAMVFAMPMALYPAMAADWGGASAAGWLYSAIPAGSLIVTLLSGWTKNITRKGAAVILAATSWGVAIIGLSFMNQLAFAFIFLALAGGADMISGIFRSAIWNETIPHDRRGRLASIEMLSYMSGPMLGNARAGYVAHISSNFISILSGGIICAIACLACIWLLPKFWFYRSERES